VLRLVFALLLFGQVWQGLAFEQSNTRDRDEGRCYIVDARCLVDLLPFAVMKPDELLNGSRYHFPMSGTHVHSSWDGHFATNSMAVMFHSVQYGSAHARAKSYLVPSVLRKKEAS
jgi:hypothetical protein